MNRRHIGTIIDINYFEEFKVIDRYNNEVHKKICPYCREEVDLWAEKVGTYGQAVCCLPHECKNWVDEARRQVKYIENYLLSEQGFIFIPVRKD
jgi:hypothetical protein